MVSYALLAVAKVQQTLPLADNPHCHALSSVRVLMCWRHMSMPLSPILFPLTFNAVNEVLPVIIKVLLATIDSGTHLSKSSLYD